MIASVKGEPAQAYSIEVEVTYDDHEPFRLFDLIWLFPSQLAKGVELYERDHPNLVIKQLIPIPWPKGVPTSEAPNLSL